jgi:hypothetical protein
MLTQFFIDSFHFEDNKHHQLFAEILELQGDHAVVRVKLSDQVLRPCPLRAVRPVVKVRPIPELKSFKEPDLTKKTVHVGVVHDCNVPVIPPVSFESSIAAFDKRVNVKHNRKDDVSDSTKIAAGAALDILCPTGMSTIAWEEEYPVWLEGLPPDKAQSMKVIHEERGDQSMRDYVQKVVFPKIEALLKREDKETPDYGPRVVFEGLPEYNYIDGPITNCLARRFKELCLHNPYEVNTWKYYQKVILGSTVSGLAAEEYMSQIPAGKCTFVSTDFTANDASQVPGVTKIYGQFVQRLGAPDWYLRGNTQIRHIATDRKAGYVAEVIGQLLSGMNKTYLNNTWWNMVIKYDANRRIQKELFSRGSGRIRSTSFFLGDDGLSLYRHYEDWFATYIQAACEDARMKVKIQVSDQPSKIDFLSKCLVLGDYCGSLVPKPGRMLCRWGVRSNLNPSLTDDQYLAGKCLSYAYEHRNLPTISKIFLDRFAELDFDCGSYFYQDYRFMGMVQKEVVPSMIEKILSSENLEFEFEILLLNRYEVVTYAEYCDVVKQTVSGVVGTVDNFCVRVMNIIDN